MGRQRSYKTRAETLTPYEEAFGPQRVSPNPAKKKSHRKKEFVPADPRCKQCYYWRYLGCVDGEVCNCCHYALFEGKLRKRVSQTECGSYKDKNKGKERKPGVDTVPMTQWGVGGLGIVRRGER